MPLPKDLIRTDSKAARLAREQERAKVGIGRDYKIIKKPTPEDAIGDADGYDHMLADMGRMMDDEI